MTISSTNCKAIYVTSSAVTEYAYNFKIFHAAQLRVTVVDAATRAETDLALTLDYGVSGVGNASGGVVGLSAAGLAKAGGGHKLVILRHMEFTQETDYRPHDVFPAETHEQALDILTMMGQELRERLGRAVLRTPDEDEIIPYHDLVTLLGNVNSFKAAAEAAAGLATAKADEAKAAATEAKTARTQAQTARAGAEAAAELATQKAEGLYNLTVTAVETPGGTPPTADYDPATGNMLLGIPAGPQGEKGAPGDTGAAGPRGETGPQGPKGDQGETGEAGTGIIILGKLTDESRLPAAGNLGDGYLIESDLYVWSATTGNWQNAGAIRGPKGDKGETGSAGPQGEAGPQGPKGETGEAGPAGSDATVPAATTTVAGKVTLATDTDKADAAKVPSAAVVQGWLAEVSGGFSTLDLITTSGSFTAKKTGYHKITSIGGGGAGGGSLADVDAYDGSSGGRTSFASIAADGGAGGFGGMGIGGGGGGAGLVKTGYLYLTAGEAVAVVIGAGGTGASASMSITGEGAPGASNGTRSPTGTRAGAGGRNDYGYGNGGQGGDSSSSTGSDGLNGAVFLEY